MILTRRQALRALPVMAAGVGAASCGYALAGRGSFLPEYIKTLGIPMFGNTTPNPTIEQTLTQKVREEFQASGRYTVIPSDAGADGEPWEPVITDFGLARRVDTHGDHSLTGRVVGTPGYMAPEQAAGLVELVGGELDARREVLTHIGHRAGQRLGDADLDGPGLAPARPRDDEWPSCHGPRCSGALEERSPADSFLHARSPLAIRAK